MRFNKFLNERETDTKQIINRSKSIQLYKAYDLIEKNCKNILKVYRNNSDNLIYRGLNNHNDALYFDSSKSKPRKSKDLPNYYTLLIDNLPSWKLFPKRSESIICTSGYSDAEGYGQVYAVFPYDNAKIGVCPKEDIWFSFTKNLWSLSSFAKQLRNFMKNFLGHIPSDDSWELLKKEFIKVENEIQNKDWDDVRIHTMETLYADKMNKWVSRILKGEHFVDVFNDILDPNDNSFLLTTTDTKIQTKSVEMWFSDKCILISDDHADDIILEDK